ncbi:MAG: pilus assembly protein [Propionibacteriaceae bacterium]|nr:pilus assembly protein [Propionibacteriaceae bacterium]
MLAKWRSRKSQRGAAALEFALVAPILIMLVFGVVDFGMMINSQAVFANAARDAARAGSFSATESEIVTVVNSEVSYLPNITNVATTVTCRLPGSPGANCSGSYDAGKKPGGTVVVRISYQHHWLTPALLGLPSVSVVTKASEMRIE